MATKYFKRTFIRPNTSVPFYTSDAAFVTAIKNSCIDTGNCIKWREQSLQDNGLILHWTSAWDSDYLDSEQGLQFLNTLEVLIVEEILLCKTYCEEHNILMSDMEEFVV